MKVSDYILDFLYNKHVENVFFLPGGGCMHLLDSLAKSKMKAASLLHEQSVAIACEAYANTKAEMGVALVTSGPGATNIITPLLAAYIDSSPCFFLVGQMKTCDLRDKYKVRALGSQEADIVAIAKPACKYAVQIKNKENIRYELEKAWHIALSGRRGPVLLDIPLDIQGTDIDPGSLKGYLPEAEKENIDISALTEALSKAKRPLFIAGNGLSSCREEFKKMLALYGIPVITTWKNIDILSTEDELYAGHGGGMGDRHGNLAMQNADCIVSFASRLDFSITGYNRTQWAIKAKKFIIDIDSAELDKFEVIKEDIVSLNANVSFVVNKLIEEKKNISLQKIDDWKEHIVKWKKKYPIIDDDKCYTKDKKITTYGFIKHLCKLLPKNACIAPCSSGTTAEIFFQAFQVKDGQTIRSNHGLGSMGFEIPNAIGMSIARENEDVICIAGDGGMQLNIQELAVIKGKNLPIKLFVVNNNGYASIRNMQKGLFEERFIACDGESGLYLPDMKQLSLAYNLPYVAIESKYEIDSVITEALTTKGPIIVEVFVDKDCIVSPKTATQIMPDGSMQSSPLENQYPFLSEEEVRDNCL